MKPDAPCPVIVMAKAPRPGYAKTRLVPALGEAGAAALALRLLHGAVDEAFAARLGVVDLCAAPDASDPQFNALARAGLSFSAQGDGDLGARMQRAFARWLPQAGQALMTGTDCPALTATVLLQAAQALATADAVFVPAFDGGYALIGLRGRSVAAFTPLFDAMPWSTAGLMDATRLRLAAAGLAHVELPALHDIDEPADLLHLPAHLAADLPAHPAP
jgi:rSAM/selenodomain-associated transferase 1